MAEKRSIYIRFNMEDKADKELYLKLTEASENSASLTAYVKKVLGEYLNLNVKVADRQEFHDQMLSVVREEMQAQGMKLVGALLAGIGTVSVTMHENEIIAKGTELPENCKELPEELKGVLNLIG